MSKQEILKSLQRVTEEITEIGDDSRLTTEGICEAVGVQRNTASQYLNELVKEQIAFKVKTRPALFFHRETFVAKFFPIKQDVYDSLAQLKNEGVKQNQKENGVFDSIIGSKSSLKMVIDQIKAAVFYPGTGLPMMFHGETGVGKSLLAKKAFEYCVEQKMVSETAAFLELNCAQYYHNPELLSSILFGYKKGAFTGADENQVGMLEAADGGILFLDECHRLSPESQEKLFTFMDNGTFSRIGENNHKRKAKVRLIFATTENLQTSFLRTFTRRVPITVEIPSLQERTSQELLEYLYTFFISESQQFGKEFLVTPWIINRLMSIHYRDNVGELKNMIKIICANAYSKQADKQVVMINSEALENSLLSKFLSLKEIDNTEDEDVLITPDSKVESYMRTENAEIALMRGIFKVFQQVMSQYQEKNVSAEYVIQQLAREASTVVEMLVYDTPNEDNALKLLQRTIKELVNFLETNFYINISGNTIVALTSYLYKRPTFAPELPNFEPKLAEEIREFITIHLLTEQKVLNALLELVESKLDVVLNESEKILLAFYLKGLDLQVKKPLIRGVILAHGFSTASSIADVVNRFMEGHLYDAFDMPFNVNLDKVQEFMQRYIKTNDCSKGLVILADMGSLMVLTDTLKESLDGPMLMLNNVTTQQALFVAEMIKKNTDLEVIGERITESHHVDYKVIYPQRKKNPLVITVCHTGLGAAQQLKEFLSSSIPPELNYHVEAVDYHYLKKYGKDNTLFKQYDVQGIVGTADPKLSDISFVSLEDLISGQGVATIDDIFQGIKDASLRKKINDNLVRNLSIERLLSAITILDVQRVIAYIDEVLTEIERRLKVELTNNKKAILYVHIASLVERSIRNHEVAEYKGEEDPSRSEPLAIIADAMEVLENAYNIQISGFELNYLYDIIFDR